MALESTATNKPIQDWITSIGGYCIKTVSTNRAGTHDIIACIDGHFASIEGKVDNNTTSVLQSVHAKEVYAAGGFAMVAWSLREVKVAILKWKKLGYPPTCLGQFKEVQKFTL